MKTIEDDRIICVFMGCTIKQISLTISEDPYKTRLGEHVYGLYKFVPDNRRRVGQGTICGASRHLIDNLKFNSSFDWIIPVVKEIHQVEQTYLFDDTDVIDNLTDAMLRLDLDEIYEAVVAFIKYHNENKV